MSPRVVLDTSVLVAALRSDRGASRALLVSALEGRFRPLASVPLMIEYEAVLTRTEHLEVSGLTAADLGELLDALSSVIQPVRLAYLWRPTLEDPGDELVLETAVNGRANLLVTLNRRHFLIAEAAFGMRIASPGEALSRLSEEQS